MHAILGQMSFACYSFQGFQNRGAAAALVISETRSSPLRNRGNLSSKQASLPCSYSLFIFAFRELHGCCTFCLSPLWTMPLAATRLALPVDLAANPPEKKKAGSDE
jgi:hypothetical protein